MQATTTEVRPAIAPGLTSIGAKAIMAITGAGLTLFVIFHMLGNLQVFLGPEELNRYAAFLKSVPEVLWAARLGLLAMFVAHIYVAVWLTIRNKAARPVPYVFQATRQASIASRTMMYSGVLILAFVIFHLAHYTFGWLYPEYLTFRDPKDQHDVYRMTVEGFKVWWISLAYIVSMLLLGLHLSHGISSLFRTLGVSNPRHMRCIRLTGFSLAMILMVGNISMPVAVLLGIIR